VKDLAMIASVISGPDLKDSTSGPIEVPPYHLRLATDLKGMKIGIPKEYFVEGMEPGIVEKVREAIKEIEKLGAKSVEVNLPSTKYGALVYAIICPSEVSSNLARYDGIRYGYVSGEAQDLLEVYQKTRAVGFGNEAKRRIMVGTYVLSAGYYDAYYKKAQKVRRLIVDEFAQVFKEVDVLLAPTSPIVAPPLGKFADNPIFAYIADILNIPANLAGLASLSVPCGFVEPSDIPSEVEGLKLPVGLQIIGPQWGEQKIFNVGHAYQTVTDWHKKHPSLAEG
jgi:aspartyl-tRNA(Asn)/glutamyl-tRNA(Gln) amidotransferase subunit A